MERKLVSVQRILEVTPIEGSDFIERIKILGWELVSKKGNFKVGDLACYFETDSLLPFADWSSFLWKKGDDGKPTFRLKTVKLRGQVSQGLALPLSILVGKKFPTDQRENPVYEWHEGQEITALLGVTKYEPPIPAQLAGVVKGLFPCFVPKTDELRVQGAPSVLQEIAGKEVYITTKCDGSSCTIYYNHGDYGVCSRNLEFKEEDTSTFSEVARKYDLKAKLTALGRNLAIQAECCGEGIQKNRMGLKGHDLFVFNVYNIDSAEYLNMADAFEIADKLGLHTVPVDAIMVAQNDWTVEKLLKLAEGMYPGTSNPREGIVVRPVVECYSAELKGRLSFKIINNTHLINGGD